MSIIQKLLLIVLSLSCFNSYAIYQCEVDFVKLVNGELPKDLNKNPMQNLWDERFRPSEMVSSFRQISKEERFNLLKEFTKLVNKDKTYAHNLALLASRLKEEGLITSSDIRKLFLKKRFLHMNFYYSQARHELTAQAFFDPEKLNYLNRKMKSLGLDEFYRKEYRTTLLQSNRTADDIEAAFEHGMKFRQDRKSLEQFKAYIDFLDSSKPRAVKKGLKHIEDIYKYDIKPSKIPIDSFKAPHKHFLTQQARLQQFELKRYREIQRTFKLHQKNGVVREIDNIADKEANGFFVS